MRFSLSLTAVSCTSRTCNVPPLGVQFKAEQRHKDASEAVRVQGSSRVLLFFPEMFNVV